MTPPLPGPPPDRISLSSARRIALSAQGLARARPAEPSTSRRLTAAVGRIGLVQIDSVNVLSRMHYLPLFSRLGAYSRTLLDEAAWGEVRRRGLFEYWAHEASLLPLEIHPLLRWRMARALRGEGVWTGLRPFAGERRPFAETLLRRIADDGPMAGSDLENQKGSGGWWGWSEGKSALEWLFWCGRLTTRSRRASFERVYDLPERVLPGRVLETPDPPEADAHRELLRRSAQALGIGTLKDLRDYFRLSPEDARPRLQELVEAGDLLPVRVEGWSQEAYLWPAAACPRRAAAASLLAPFDPLIWERGRTERLFNLRYRIEIYTPKERRSHGYYVLPFLLGERIAARVDLKADRARGILRVMAAHREPDAPDHLSEALAAELRTLGGWLGLDGIEVEPLGDFVDPLRAALGCGRAQSLARST